MMTPNVTLVIFTFGSAGRPERGEGVTAVRPLLSISKPLQGAWLVAAKSVWYLLAGLAVVVFIVGVATVYYSNSDICTFPLHMEACTLLGSLGLTVLAPTGLALYTVSAVSLMALAWMLMGWLVFLRSPVSVASLLMSLGLATGWATDLTGHPFADAFFFGVSHWLPALIPLAWVFCYVILVAAQVTVVALVFLLPDGLLRPRWSAPLILLWSAHVAVNSLYHPPFMWFQGSRALETLDEFFVIAMPLAVIFVVWFKHRSATGRAKAQLKALLPSILAFTSVYLGFSLWNLLIWWPPGATGGNTLRFASHFVQVGVQSACGAWFGIAIGTAILRYNLFATDLFVSRTLVYGGLSGVLLLVYLSIVFGVGSLFGLSDAPWFSLAATALTVVLFQPLRTYLKERVNRTLYGARDLPFREFVGLSRQLQSVPQDYFPSTVQTISRHFKLPFVRIVVNTGALATEAQVGTLQGETVRFPISSQGQTLGWLEVAVKPGEVLATEECTVLETIAGQLGVIIRSLELTTELQAARQKLVIAREEERRRLQRDLHDGLGPAIAAQTLVVSAARRLLKIDPQHAEQLLGTLENDIDRTLAQMRSLVHGLRPPDLDRLGLVAALGIKVRELTGETLRLELVFPEAKTAYPAAVEVAAYYIVIEAVSNVLRHARAQSCRVELRVVGAVLELSICDDGVGFAKAQYGVGLTSMQERAQEIGGSFLVVSDPPSRPGVRIQVSLPMLTKKWRTSGFTALREGT